MATLQGIYCVSHILRDYKLIEKSAWLFPKYIKALNNSSEKKKRKKRERHTEDFGVWMMDWFPSETFETYLLYLIYDYICVTLIKIIIQYELFVIYIEKGVLLNGVIAMVMIGIHCSTPPPAPLRPFLCTLFTFQDNTWDCCAFLSYHAAWVLFPYRSALITCCFTVNYISPKCIPAHACAHSARIQWNPCYYSLHIFLMVPQRETVTNKDFVPDVQ